ncbi:hypothetical protein PtrSN002B_005305 [Pyrenophora tritici-repentis]|uniref:Uncharacterized protein n=2 Tax=Pyrenophora tritici-repentis TaxID=45151 RepID=A0A2W1D278_9PLEO|nr:uncharacterized protein PTRG_01538 [Pyrenophora tritici-repentis Pt-1C-BFP]KAA8626199.1 hypothetical protein PtrV1_01879 [Pyrenophora tritici-repentis]EDU40976.1 conserved hypothetical protein [Pyrenophora tritici-repentis Pt-1C-BFP]KAF7454610.1 hypothetical protein A1F99_018680 [Pyrenophora tritici-repentis]KAF7577733.1 hypothetical protein PtrM4_019730 [Pyrenophora tritici-repentis]KAG9388365.1 hypothetical protein A1F94_001257 [Pyrenophora tritici-repentis]
MRLIALAASLPLATAFWNGDLCKGAGGCINIGVLVRDPFRCPDGSYVKLPDFGNDEDAAGREDATVVTKEEFPKTCFKGGVPRATSKLVRTKARGGQTMYHFVDETCNNANPVKKDCYHYNSNPSTFTFCQMIDSKGGQCVTNPNAGKCERWGNDIRPECNYWKPGLQDLPDDN